MIMKKILFLILIITLSGCVSRKTAVKENIKFNAVENVDTSVKETAGHSSYSDVVKDVKTSVQDKTITRTTETEFSEPDESGRQHKTKEKTTETLNDIAVLNEQNERIISEQNQIIERQGSYISALETRLSATLNEKTKTTTRAPMWTYIVAAGIGAAGATFTRKWLKKIFKP